MKVGETTFIVFVSKLLGSLLGFFATIYFARILGATVLGQLAVTMALISWLKLGGNAGFSAAVTKRVSEQAEEEAHVSAGLIFVTGTGVLLSVGVLLFREQVEQYVGVSVATFVVGILISQMIYTVVTSILNGQRRVHISGLLNGIKVIVTKLLQLFFVYSGLKLSGLLIGQWLSLLLVITVGLYLSNLNFPLPQPRHFRSLWEYAKFSWLSGLRSQSFNNVDILILGYFVTSSLIGVYSVAWSISKFLSLFNTAMKETVFPEISHSDAKGDPDAVANLVTESLRFSGIITIPGLVGAFLIGGRLLRIYGTEFQQGTEVLVLLVFAILVYGYQQQILSGLNAIDRPDLAFRIDLVFIGINIAMNISFIPSIGWAGAALATALSTVGGLLFSYYYLNKLVDFTLPYRSVGAQVLAAMLMGVIVYGLLQIEQEFNVLEHNTLTVLTIVILGTVTYSIGLWAVSSRFRETVKRNIRFHQFIPDRFVD